MIPGVHSSMVGYAAEGYKPGGSLRAWRDYFPLAQITGIDPQPDTQITDEWHITTHLGYSTRPEDVARHIQGNFDIIIDDGSHHPDDQMATLRNLWSHVRKGGLYVIEDIYSDAIETDIREITPDYFFHKHDRAIIAKPPICETFKAVR